MKDKKKRKIMIASRRVPNHEFELFISAINGKITQFIFVLHKSINFANIKCDFNAIGN